MEYCRTFTCFVIILSLPKRIAPRSREEAIENFAPLINDMSLSCLDDYSHDVFIPYGKGSTDASVTLITDSFNVLNCSIRYHVVKRSRSGSKIRLILVIEFITYMREPRDPTTGSFAFCDNVIGLITVAWGPPGPDRNVTDICEEHNDAIINNRQSFFIRDNYINSFEDEEVEVYFYISRLMATIKVTASAARCLKRHENCDAEREVVCELKTGTVCLTNSVICDGNINCGSINEYDEASKICDEQEKTTLWVAASYGVLTLAIVVFLAIQLLRVCVPKASGNYFIFNEDEDNKLILTSQLKLPYAVDLARRDMDSMSSDNALSGTSKSMPAGPRIGFVSDLSRANAYM